LEGLLEMNNKNRSVYVYEILSIIGDSDKFYDSFTKDSMSEVIDKKSDIEKETNLKFIEDLSDDSRQSFKGMIKFGLQSWKKLSTQNKDMYFPKPMVVSGTEILPQDPVELEEMNRNLAINDLGEDYTEGEYDMWMETRGENSRADQLAYEERDILVDEDYDDGDGFMDN
jgi:hypothetical protein